MAKMTKIQRLANKLIKGFRTYRIQIGRSVINNNLVVNKEFTEDLQYVIEQLIDVKHIKLNVDYMEECRATIFDNYAENVKAMDLVFDDWKEDFDGVLFTSDAKEALYQKYFIGGMNLKGLLIDALTITILMQLIK